MRVFAFSVGLKRLFSFAAAAAVALALLVLSGCGHRCGCAKNNCNTCKTCGMAEDVLVETDVNSGNLRPLTAPGLRRRPCFATTCVTWCGGTFMGATHP